MIIVLEGCDASGKTTHALWLAEKLNASFFSFPAYETPYGQLIKEHLQSTWTARWTGLGSLLVRNLDAMVFQALQLANRMEMAVPMAEADERGDVVLARYIPSGYVYGSLDGLDPNWLLKSQEWLIQPDLNILLDIDPEMSAQRRPERQDRYEKQNGLMEKVVQRYRELWTIKANVEPKAWKVVDARGTIEQTAEAIMTEVTRRRS